MRPKSYCLARSRINLGPGFVLFKSKLGSPFFDTLGNLFRIPNFFHVSITARSMIMSLIKVFVDDSTYACRYWSNDSLYISYDIKNIS